MTPGDLILVRFKAIDADGPDTVPLSERGYYSFDCFIDASGKIRNQYSMYGKKVSFYSSPPKRRTGLVILNPDLSFVDYEILSDGSELECVNAIGEDARILVGNIINIYVDDCYTFEISEVSKLTGPFTQLETTGAEQVPQ